jgi:histidyl-tRNA synthetase
LKAQTLKGTRDFLPDQIAKRKYIFDLIESVFKKFAFVQIETPAMEAMTTLSGKYGEEGDKLLFKILNNGDFLEKADEKALLEKDSYKLAPSIAKRGLRYDLTVPFARFVVNNQNDLVFPFKRYQIQPVWRADRPQKGRYQEFYQCDADVVGSDSLVYEAELVCIYHEVFKKLGIAVKIKINNRKILFGLSEAAGIPDQFADMTIAIDKLDKIGKDGVAKELSERGISSEATDKIFQMLEVRTIEELSAFFKEGSQGSQGIDEILKVYKLIGKSNIDNLAFDIKLARGLGYYTGCIFEVSVDTEIHQGLMMGSIGGGGRYDNLTAGFGLPGMSGVGISFGAERIYDVLTELALFPENVSIKPLIVLMAMDQDCLVYAFKVAAKLRESGLYTDIYPEAGKLKKQIKFAADKGVRFAGIIGDQEMKDNLVMCKNLASGEQNLIHFESLASFLLA